VLSSVRERTARDGLPDASVEKDRMEFSVYSLGSLVLNVKILLSFSFLSGFSMLLVLRTFCDKCRVSGADP
jgi:hypothetical protein